MRGVTGRQRWGGRRVACGLAAVLFGAQALTGCGPMGSSAGPDADDRSVQRLLDRWADALRGRDEAAFLAAVDPRATGYRAARQRVFDRLKDVPLAAYGYRLVRRGGFTPAAGDGRRVAVEAELRYRIAGYDTAPVTAPARLTLVKRDGRWYVAAQDDRDASRQLWEHGTVTVVRGAHSLVLGVGQDRGRLRALAGLADRAVPAVGAAWRGKWAGRVVVEMPASLDTMAALLGAPATGYRGIAAVTTGEVGGAGAAPADRIIVNPEAYGVLGDFGRRVVLTHETAHVATRALTSPATPLWLSEGFADWAAYRDTDRTPRQAAPELARAVTGGELPRRLPEDGEFGFAGESGRLARAYEEGWLACRMIADEWGEEKLVAFYRAVGGHSRRAGAVEAALHDVLGVNLADFTARWRAYLEAALG
ncbi:hypothetical protein ACFWAT_29190 [Streptomyces syringium]|uniref:hypothetical protein n=1 Tax=Streptomyces syringium TaxID=76729 RepID=UPI003654802F